MTEDQAAGRAERLDRLHAEVARCPYHDFLGLVALNADPAGEWVVIGLPFRPELRLAADSDAFHGGVLATLADVTAHAVVACTIGRVAPTIDLRIDFLALARGELLTATGRLLRAGRSVARADVEVRDPGGRLVVAGRGTFSTR